MTLIRLRTPYEVDQVDVQLTVTVGQGQKCYIEVLLDGQLIASGKSIHRNLGPGKLLEGRRLRVTTSVTDTNPSTNHTSVTYELTGGLANEKWVSEHTVPSPGESVDYDAIFTLL